MESVGVWLRQARERLDATVEDAEAATRIRARFLEALEAGNFATFPGGEVQIRGFLRIYARYLGLPADEALARYEAEARWSEATETQPSAPPTATTTGIAPQQTVRTTSPARPTVAPPPGTFVPPPPPPASLGRRRISFVPIAVVAIVFLLVGITVIAGRSVLQGVWQSVTHKEVANPAASMATSGSMLFPTATPLSTTASSASGGEATPLPATQGQGAVTLTLTAGEHVWVRVTRDGSMAFQGTLAPGEPHTWSGEQAIVVETGNGAGVEVTVNGQPQGVMCGRGQVCTRAWGPDGEIPLSGE